ncbi:hypothetical protein IMG5_027630, partial [Ichthyophthirius multifiliis]
IEMFKQQIVIIINKLQKLGFQLKQQEKHQLLYNKKLFKFIFMFLQKQIQLQNQIQLFLYFVNTNIFDLNQIKLNFLKIKCTTIIFYLKIIISNLPSNKLNIFIQNYLQKYQQRDLILHTEQKGDIHYFN